VEEVSVVPIDGGISEDKMHSMVLSYNKWKYQTYCINVNADVNMIVQDPSYAHWCDIIYYVAVGLSNYLS
jgi:hypothetical protein